VHNAGGLAVLATDSLVTQGSKLTQLSDETMAELNGVLPPHCSHQNPADVQGDAESERYMRAVEVVSNDPNNE
jgi:acetyltransferase